MGLLEFLRQWQRSRLAAGVALSVVLHVLLIGALAWKGAPWQKAAVRRGEPLMVELPPADDSPPPGLPGRPTTRPSPPAAPAPKAPPTKAVPAPKAPPAPRVAPAPPPPAPKVAAPAPPAPARPERAPTPAPPKPPEPAPPRVASAAPPTPEAGPDPAAGRPAAQTPAASTPPTAGQPSAPPAARPSEASPDRGASGRQIASVPPSTGAPPAGATDIRTALRRGTGGAGGSGSGRAGIEGEPIPLDSADPKYSDYLDQIRRRIKEKWGYPCVKNEDTRECEYKTAQLVIEFGILKNGQVPFVNVVKSSGYPIYDDYAVNAVKLASPFPAIPDTFSKKGVPIHATFSYVVQSSLTNILR